MRARVCGRPFPLRLLHLVSLVAASTASKFSSLNTCEACVAAGHGWSVAKAKCGGFSNRVCNGAAPARATATGKYAEQINTAAQSCGAPCSSTKECFFGRIEHDLKSWSDDGGIKNAQFLVTKGQHGGRLSHYQVVGGRLYRDERCRFDSRCTGIEYFLHWILAEDSAQLVPKTQRLPDMEFLLNTADYPFLPRLRPGAKPRAAPIFSFSVDKNHGDVMYPAWTFWAGGPAISLYPTGLGRWDKKREDLIKAQKKFPWRKKKNIGFFRGARTTDERDALVFFSDKHPELLDAQYTANYKRESGLPGRQPVQDVELEDHCKYRFLFNARGVAASFRYKHLFLCQSLVFNIGEDWVEFFYPALRPWVHYVPLKEDMSDAEDKLRWAADPANKAAVRKIARAGFELVRDHLTNVAVKDYWRALLQEYGSLAKWDVTVAAGNQLKKPDKEDRRRGQEQMVFPNVPKNKWQYA